MWYRKAKLGFATVKHVKCVPLWTKLAHVFCAWAKQTAYVQDQALWPKLPCVQGTYSHRSLLKEKCTPNPKLVYRSIVYCQEKKKGGEEVRGFSTVRGAPQNGDGQTCMRQAEPLGILCYVLQGWKQLFGAHMHFQNIFIDRYADERLRVAFSVFKWFG